METAPCDAGGRRLADLLDAGVLLDEEWDELTDDAREGLLAADPDDLLGDLQSLGLLTAFQRDKAARGRLDEAVIAQYRLLSVLGRGGMGVVYRAEHRFLRTQVAIKVFRPTTGHPQLARRFWLEARAVARLRHPNLVACLDAGVHKGSGRPDRGYYVMELVEGADLATVVAADGPLPVGRSAHFARQAADALAEAHRHGLVHRDIKPTNLMVGPADRVKVLDFGMARHPQSQLTTPGMVLGSVGYMAPEQVTDPQGVDARADLFGLGAALFFAVTGRPPFPESGNPTVDLSRRLTAPPPRSGTALDAVIAQLMAPDRRDRFASAGAAGAALGPFADDTDFDLG